MFDWYRDLWTGVVLPNQGVLLPVLALAEGMIAVAVLSRGRRARTGLVAGAVFNVCVAPLGFWWPTNAILAAVHVVLFRVEFPESVVERFARTVAVVSDR
ncbi:hypothetical protein ACFQL4_02850 [Halosimplex aquaticum]